MSTNSIDSLPPLPPQEMSSILGDSSAVQALGGADPAGSLPGTGAFLDLSSTALQLTSSEQIEMAELEDDAALFGASVGSSSVASMIQPAPTPVDAPFDPTADPGNPAYGENQPDTFDWSQDLTNPGFWA
jgi:hypothetical protein